MPTKLKGLKIKRVALVDEGANPDAHIRFAKRKEDVENPAAAETDTISEEQAQGLAKRVADFIVKMFRPAQEPEDVEKDAHTFGEAEAVRNYDAIMDKEVWPMMYAMADSVRSILFDTGKSTSEKEALIKTSVSEFSTALTAYAGSWATAQLSDTTVSKSADLVALRDQLTAAIEKANGENEPDESGKPGEDPDNPTPNNEPTDTDEGSSPADPVTKGATDMKFNTEAMTPEELAQYEDLAKRFGSEDDTNNQPAENDGDIYKGLNPAVKAEIESLRKYREEAEQREMLQIAKKYELLGKKPEELAKSLMAMKAAGGTAYNDMIAVLDSSLEAVEKSGTFSEIGKRGTSGSNNDAWSKIETAASEIQKSKPTMTWADAIDQACMQHPDLLEAYEKSRQ